MCLPLSCYRPHSKRLLTVFSSSQSLCEYSLQILCLSSFSSHCQLCFCQFPLMLFKTFVSCFQNSLRLFSYYSLAVISSFFLFLLEMNEFWQKNQRTRASSIIYGKIEKKYFCLCFLDTMGLLWWMMKMISESKKRKTGYLILKHKWLAHPWHELEKCWKWEMKNKKLGCLEMFVYSMSSTWSI